MSAYIRKYISTCEAFGWEGGPAANTHITLMRNKAERRNAQWDQPQHSFTVPFQNLTQPYYVPIKQMHLNRRGAWGCFLYRDRLDDTADSDIFAVALSGEDTFQLAKVSQIEGVQYFRNVTAIYTPADDGTGDAVQSNITVLVDDVPTTAYLLDYNTGVIVFDTPMSGGEVLKWSGKFSLWVRFQNDYLPFSIDNKSSGEFVVNGTISLLEMLPPQSGEVES